jgi:hypothetical protein
MAPERSENQTPGGRFILQAVGSLTLSALEFRWGQASIRAFLVSGYAKYAGMQA